MCILYGVYIVVCFRAHVRFMFERTLYVFNCVCVVKKKLRIQDAYTAVDNYDDNGTFKSSKES